MTEPNQSALAALLHRCDRLLAERGPWEGLWQDVADYCLPRPTRPVAAKGPVRARGDLVFDGTVQAALRVLAASLHGLLTAPGQPWFHLTCGDETLDGADGVRVWLDHARDRLMAAFSDPAAQFYPQIHELYLELAAFGTAILSVEDEAQGVRFVTRPLAECALGENEAGRIDLVVRRFRLSVRQALARFGDAAGPLVRRAAEQATRLDEEIEHLHVVLPRGELGFQPPGAELPYVSLYIEQGSRCLVGSAGYHEFPFMAVRWEKLAGDTYGRSPVMLALPDIKTLNAILRTVLKGAQKAVDPPVQVPDDGVSGPINLSPGAVNLVRADYARQGAGIQPIALGSRVDIGLELVERYRAAIRAALMSDHLLMQTTANMTATEVLQRTEERLRVLGPVLGRLQSELLGPLIGRVFAILKRRGQLLPPPPGLVGRSLTLRYVSPLAQAQRLAEAEGVVRTLDVVRPLAETAPEVMDVLNLDEVPRVLADVFAAPPALLRGQEEVAQRRALRLAGAVWGAGI